MKNEAREDFRLGWRCGVADAYVNQYHPQPPAGSCYGAYREGYLRGHAARIAGLPTESSEQDWLEYSRGPCCKSR